MVSGPTLLQLLVAVCAGIGALWLQRRLRRRELVQQMVLWLGLLAVGHCLGALLSSGWSDDASREVRLMQMMVGVAMAIQVGRTARSWFPVGTVSWMDGGDRPPWGMVLPGVAALALAVGVVVDDGVVSVQYERMIGLSALGFALTYLGIRAVAVMPQMSPNDIIRHHPWALCAGGLGAALLVPLWVDAGPVVIGAQLVAAVLVWPLVIATDHSAQYELTVERAGSDSVVALQDALFLLRPDGVIDYANPAAHRMLRGEPKGVHIRRVCPDWPRTGRTVLIRSDATRLPVLLNSAPLLAGEDQVGLAVSLTDVTELEQAVEDAQVATKRADAAARARQEFLAVMSHEIRTPLNAVLGLAHLLRSTELDAEQAEWVQTICQSSDSLLAILNDTLDFARIESGKLQIERIPMHPGEQIRSTMRMVENLAESARLSLESNIEALPNRVRGDPTRIRQILLNLLSNAIKFTERGSVRVDAHYADGELTVAVVDTGVGIAPDRLEHLFDAFVQEDLSTTRRYGGVGLGLAISRKLAELMNGTLSVVSTLGSGSTFTLTIPAPIEAVAMEEANTEPTVGLPRKSVLVVDDNPVNQMVLQTMLERFGMRCDVATDGEAGVRKVLEGSFDIVFMDLQMPVKDGWDAILEITDAMGDARPYLISHSAGVVDDDAQRASDNGAHTHLNKPARPADVYRTLRRAIQHMEQPAAR